MPLPESCQALCGGYKAGAASLSRERHFTKHTYDDVNRLSTYDRGDLNVARTPSSGTPVSEEDWGLDMTGNWSDFLQKTSGSTDLDQDRTHNDVSEITGISETTGTAWIDPVHDKAENMTTVPKPSSPASGLTCKWDAWNHLVEVKEGATVVAKYEYDGLAPSLGTTWSESCHCVRRHTSTTDINDRLAKSCQLDAVWGTQCEAATDAASRQWKACPRRALLKSRGLVPVDQSSRCRDYWVGKPLI